MTTEGHQYFLTLVDDYTRMTWIYLMHSKADATQLILAFYRDVLTQYGAKIKGIRSDNAHEFNLSSFYSKVGIQSYHAYVETPQ